MGAVPVCRRCPHMLIANFIPKGYCTPLWAATNMSCDLKASFQKRTVDNVEILTSNWAGVMSHWATKNSMAHSWKPARDPKPLWSPDLIIGSRARNCDLRPDDFRNIPGQITRVTRNPIPKMLAIVGMILPITIGSEVGKRSSVGGRRNYPSTTKKRRYKPWEFESILTKASGRTQFESIR